MIITSEKNPIFRLKQILPQKVSQALSRLDNLALDRISEIRLYSGSAVFVTIEAKNMMLTTSGLTAYAKNAICVTKEEIEDFIYKFCKGSVYSHEDTLSEFYLCEGGIRIGIGGDAVYKNGQITSVGNISSINIRIPRHIPDCSAQIMNLIEQQGFPDGKGILVISPPGVGKTTLLRDLARKISCAESEYTGHVARRVTVIDERCEIYMENVFKNCCIDFLSGIDKIKGIEIASRLLSPELIVCDEIATPEEAEKITRRKNGGIVFAASIHAESYDDIMKKDYIRKMFDEGVFGTVFCLSRNKGNVSGSLYRYTAE